LIFTICFIKTMRWTPNGDGGYPKPAGYLNLLPVEARRYKLEQFIMVTSKRTRKPKSATSSPKVAAAPVQQVSLSTEIQDAIRSLAYSIYEQRGRQHGHDLDDWLIAEAEVACKAYAQSA
jgi:hypothetical protein